MLHRLRPHRRRCSAWIVASGTAVFLLVAGVAVATTVTVASVTASLPKDNRTHTVSPTCPAGTKAAGGGVRLSDNFDDFVQGSYPSATNDRIWVARALRGASGTASFTGYALCIKGRLKYVSHKKKLANDSATHTVTATCPSGTRVTGGGIRLGDVSSDYVEGSYPSGTTGWTAAAFRYMKETTTSSFTAWAVCLPAGRVTVKSKQFALPHDGAGHTGTVGCPTGTHVTDGGVKLSDPDHDTPEGMYPAGKTGWTGAAARYGAGKAAFTVFAVCIK